MVSPIHLVFHYTFSDEIADLGLQKSMLKHGTISNSSKRSSISSFASSLPQFFNFRSNSVLEPKRQSTDKGKGEEIPSKRNSWLKTSRSDILLDDHVKEMSELLERSDLETSSHHF